MHDKTRWQVALSLVCLALGSLLAAPWVAAAEPPLEGAPPEEAEALEIQLEVAPSLTPTEPPALGEPERLLTALRKCNDFERQLCPAGCLCVVGDNGVECRPRPWNPEACW